MTEKTVKSEDGRADESIERREQGMTFEDSLAVLADCQARFEQLGKVVSTKDPDSLRSACDAEMRLRYELYGVKSIDVKIGGVSVGTYSAVISKEKPEQRSKKLTISDGNAIRWLMEDAPDSCCARFAREAVKIAEDYMAATGEMLPAAQCVEEILPAEPGRFKNTRLKIDPEKVAKALGAPELEDIYGRTAVEELAGGPEGSESA